MSTLLSVPPDNPLAGPLQLPEHQEPWALKESPRQGLWSFTEENPIMSPSNETPSLHTMTQSSSKWPESFWGHQDLQWSKVLCLSQLQKGNSIPRLESFKNREAEGWGHRGLETMIEASSSEHSTGGVTRGTSRRATAEHLWCVCLKHHGQHSNFSLPSTAEQNLTWGPHRKGWGNTEEGFPCDEGKSKEGKV